MPNRKTKRHRRSDEELLSDLVAELEETMARVQERKEFSPELIHTERARLELSAADYGELIGVSGLTIYNWEKGRSRPRAKQFHSWLEIKGISPREAWTRLGYE